MPIVSKLHTNYQPNDPCACDSGKKAKYCCYKNRYWKKDPAIILPELPITNYSNRDCFANVTCDCSKKISKEHYVSHGILKGISQGGKKIRIEGMSWLPTGAKKEVSTSDLVAKNLCKRHNEALSPIDKEAIRFLKVLDDYNRGFKIAKPIEELKLFCGEDIERWMLKTLIGMLQSGQLKNDDKPLVLDFDPRTIKVLYGMHQWPKDWGFYVSEEKITFRQAFGFTLIIDRDVTPNEFIGAKFRLNNFVFNFGIKARFNARQVFGIFRPKTLVFQSSKGKKFIEFSWQNGSGETAEFYLKET